MPLKPKRTLTRANGLGTILGLLRIRGIAIFRAFNAALSRPRLFRGPTGGAAYAPRTPFEPCGGHGSCVICKM